MSLIQPSLASIAFLVLICFAKADDFKFPDSVAGKRIAGFFDAINANDQEKAKAYITENVASAALERRPLKERLEVYQNIFEETGGLQPTKVLAATDEKTTLRAKAKNGQTLEFTFEFEHKPSHKLISIQLRPIAEGTDELPAGKLTDDQIVKALGSYMDKIVADDKFSGVVLLAKENKPIFYKAYGQASLRFQVPNKLDTKFNLGSMNKMLTSVSICQLAEQGKLSFDDPIIKHLPEYPNKAVAEKVTIHHLLTHTSGLGHYWNEKFRAKMPTLRTVSDFLPLFVDEPLKFEPGSHMLYSNAGFIVLGLIIEKVSRQTYYDYVREHVCRVAGMKNTDSYEVDLVVPNLAIGYTFQSSIPGPQSKNDKVRRENYYLHAVKGGPAGGGYSTAEDLLAFAVALREHRLLNSKYTTLATTGKVQMGPDGKYAYGFGDFTVNGHRHIGHNGGAPGISADFRDYLDLGYTAIVLSNYDGAAELPTRQIEALLTHK
ncbi:MAG TPA: serine hydrolase domain-containing protein [Gemmatales bacterium]|nr:serine hydrolase domain-containing protein [Gemmatales bacterium]